VRVDPVALRDEVRRGVHSPVGGFIQLASLGDVACFGGDTRERIESEYLDRSVLARTGRIEDRD
jgi:hypothetical protein